MSSRTHTAAMLGLQPIKIEVEVDTTRGQPKLIIIGLPSQTVYEAKERITAALQNCGVRIKSKRTIVNLAPADVRKKDSCFELAIAASLLKEYGILTDNLSNTIFFGELALDGKIKPMRATLPLIVSAMQMGFKRAIIPQNNVNEVAHVKGIDIYPISHLRELLNFARGESLNKLRWKKYQPSAQSSAISTKDIIGHQQAKRALEIAAAGRHNLLMIGPPGSGKSVLARSIVSLLPPLTHQEATSASKIHSLVGELGDGLLKHRPFRNPHHSISRTGLIGGGHDLHPGEISLAHHGVLFLDEINEFSRTCLESLREPLESNYISITRSLGTVEYPTQFSLLAAANPCPCGHHGSAKQACKCSQHQIINYQQKLSGPLKDRIDLNLFIEPVIPGENIKSRTENSQTEKSRLKRIMTAHKIQNKRYQGENQNSNALLNSRDVKKFCNISTNAQKLLNQAANNLSLSTRSYFSVIKVAQTIADLEDCQKITKAHIAEALQFR